MADVAGFNFDFTSMGNNGICWTTTPYTAEALAELPGIELFGYQQQWSAAITNIQTVWKRLAATNKEGGNPYYGLYSGTLTTTYKLPFFSDDHHSITNTWEENQGPLGNMVKEGVDLVKTAVSIVKPAAGVLMPKSFSSPTPASYSFSFNLINTNAGSGGDIASNVGKNKRFIESIIRDSLHDQSNAAVVQPPLIYEVYIPGIRWSPASVITGLTVKNKGTMNNNMRNLFADPTLPSYYIYPDAWEVTITINELIAETKMLYKSGSTGGPFGNITTRAIV